MTKYESNADVEPVRVATYRHIRKAFRRGWAIPVEPESSLADLASDRTLPRTHGAGRT